MARITVEDCMEHVPNRFHLVRMASIRAKQLKKGALPLLPSNENKHVVMSLREIAAGLVKPGEMASLQAALETAPVKPEAATQDVAEPTPASDTEKQPRPSRRFVQRRVFVVFACLWREISTSV
ncbi:MAG: DNA-directed RNA polymerase subunit omega [Myxococcota bacterium]